MQQTYFQLFFIHSYASNFYDTYPGDSRLCDKNIFIQVLIVQTLQPPPCCDTAHIRDSASLLNFFFELNQYGFLLKNLKASPHPGGYHFPRETLYFRPKFWVIWPSHHFSEVNSHKIAVSGFQTFLLHTTTHRHAHRRFTWQDTIPRSRVSLALAYQSQP